MKQGSIWHTEDGWTSLSIHLLYVFSKTQNTLIGQRSSSYITRNNLLSQWVFGDYVFFLFCWDSVLFFFVLWTTQTIIFPSNCKHIAFALPVCLSSGFYTAKSPGHWVLSVRKLHELTVSWIAIVSYQRKQTWHFIYMKVSHGVTLTPLCPTSEPHTDLCPELSRPADEGARTLALLSSDTSSLLWPKACGQWVRDGRGTAGKGKEHPHCCRWSSFLVSIFGKSFETSWRGDGSLTSDVCGNYHMT